MTTLTKSPIKTDRAFFALCILTALVARASFLHEPFRHDGGVYIQTGKVVAEGQHLYVDFFDTKFPGVGLLLSLPWQLFGHHWPLYILLQTAAAFLAAALLARTAGRHMGPHAKVPTALAAIVYLNFAPLVFGGFQLETLQCLFSIIAACAAIEALTSNDARDSFLVGLAAGVAAMLKPTGLAVAGAFGLTMLLQFRTFGLASLARHAAAVIAGVAIPTAGTFAWILLSRTSDSMPAVFHQVSLYGSQTPADAFEFCKPLIVALFAAIPFFIRLRTFRRSETTQLPWPRKSIVIFACCWAAIEMIGIVMQVRMYAYHFLVFGAPAALLFGMLPRSPRLTPIAAGLAPFMLLSLYASLPGALRAADGFRPSPVSDYLLAHTTPTDSIWADQASVYVIETGRPQGSRYPHTFFWVNYDTAPQDFCTGLLADFDRHRPKYLVLEKRLDRWVESASQGITGLTLRPQRQQNWLAAWDDLRAYVAQNYQLETTIGDRALWVRRTSTSPASSSAAAAVDR